MKKSFLLIEIRKDDFISMASHEFKTPITSIKIFSKILSRSVLIRDDQVSISYLSQIDQQVNKLNDLVDNILDISRIKNGEFVLSYKDFSIKQLIIDSIGLVKLNNCENTFVYYGKEDCVVSADQEKIKTVLISLLQNAIKFSPSTEKINIKSSIYNGQINISVQDNGIGIEKKYHKKIFQNFFRIHDNYGQTFPGLGIGLYLASEIVKMHHGSIRVDSSLGHGATFTFSIPQSPAVQLA